AYTLNAYFGLDPVVTGIVVLPLFYALGAAVYQLYYVSFEKRGKEALSGLAFFFGLLFITEVLLILQFGVDYRYVQASYIDSNLGKILGTTALPKLIGELPMRMLVPFVMSVIMFIVLLVFIKRTFVGRAIMAVSQDALA